MMFHSSTKKDKVFVTRKQGDQIGRIFANRATFGSSLNLEKF
jgi:hypothetical protein